MGKAKVPLELFQCAIEWVHTIIDVIFVNARSKINNIVITFLYLYIIFLLFRLCILSVMLFRKEHENM